MRIGARRRAGRAVLALLAGLLAGAWVGGGLVWVFNRTKIRVAGGQVADVSLSAADELASVPADAAGFAHVRAADLWKTDALAEYRKVIGKAGDEALKALDDGFAPAPSTIDRVTVVALAKPGHPANQPNLTKQPGIEIKGKFAPVPPVPQDPADLDVVALLTFTAPFDFTKVREVNLPKGNKRMVGETELWADDEAGVALAARGDRTLIVGPVPAVRAFLLKPKTPDGPLAPALRLAASGSRHFVGGLNLKARPLPPDLARNVPPEAAAILRADALAVGVVIGRGMKLDLRAGYKDDAAAEEAEKALRKSAEAGRKALDEAKTKAKEVLTGKANGPRPVDQLPQAVGGLFTLGAVAMLDEWLANPPLERAGPELSAAVTVDSLASTYAATAAVSVGLMLPAVQKVRAAAGRAGDQNNLKQLAIAMHAYNDTMQRLPAAGQTDPPNRPRGRPLLSWRVSILPYVGEAALYQEFKHDEPWDSPDNIKLLERMPRVFASTQPPAPPGQTHYQVFVTPDTAAVKTMFGRTVGRPLLVPDGTSNTIMIAEAADPVDWTKPEDMPYEPDGPLPRLGLPGAAGFHAAMGDGSVRFIPHTLPPGALRALIGANDGIPVPPP
ncbi:MAG TPA: DUF1559 domain-containing protein [Urbifossiella sp.]|jgi:hypothetical protein|nr:DUF1559 domain-containing protein [Urbifossiella sp.]